MDREKAIDRIRKCLALGKSTNEHEAAAAMRQAQKLMQAYDISDDDVDIAQYTSDFVDHDDYEWGNKKPLIIVAVTSLMASAFGVEATTERSPTGKHRIRYFGLKQNVATAIYAHVVAYRAVNAAWAKRRKDNPWLKGVRNARAGFAYGWCQAVMDKIEDLSPSDDEQAKIKKAREQHYGRDDLPPAELGSKSVDADDFHAGRKAGKDFSISRPVDTDRRYIEHKR